MAASVRDDEARAIAHLVALHLDGPSEWNPEHWDAAEQSARVLASWVRRDGRAARSGDDSTESGPTKRNRGKPRDRSRPRRRPKSPELLAAERVVRERSGGDCEARTPWCEGRATQAHHRAGRTDHRPEMLLDVCGKGNVDGCHGYIHQHPEESYAEGWMVKRLGLGDHQRGETIAFVPGSPDPEREG